ncbi:MAG: hypothetical protein M3P01_11135 [Actinomycetota bacterium]|nr:hypothetical protein [Actinomycetota bacterium]
MRRVLAIVAGIVVLALVGGLTLASASQRPSMAHWGLPSGTSRTTSSKAIAKSDGKHKLVLVSRNETETDIDNPPAGESQGDEINVTGSLFRNDHNVGRLDVHAVETEASFPPPRAALQATFTATLAHGQITATGVAVFTPGSMGGFEAAVTGGTGRYDEVDGDVQVLFLDNHTKFIYDLED